jgi:hypothetical protein
LKRDNVTPIAVARAVSEKHPYLRMAFANPYNLSVLMGSIAVATILQEPLLALSALSVEALWLVFAPGSALLQRLVWDPALEKARQEIEGKARAATLACLDPGERQRVETIIERQETIRSLAARNPSFTGELLRGELSKTDRLVDAFIEMALNCARYEQYLASIDPSELERDRDDYSDAAKRGDPKDQRTQIAQKNLEIVNKRLDRMAEIRRYLSVAKGQLDLIENSFQLIADQIMTMQSPKELSGQLDELLDGVEAIRETALDTEHILGPTDKERDDGQRAHSSGLGRGACRRYLRNEVSIFVLHGNVYDAVVHDGKMQSLTDFLTGSYCESKDTIAVYNLATGVRFAKRARVPGRRVDRGRARATRFFSPSSARKREDGGRHRVRRDPRAGGGPFVPGRRRPRIDRHIAPMVVPPRNREGGQHRPTHYGQPLRPVAEARLESQGGCRRSADAGSRKPTRGGQDRGFEAVRRGCGSLRRGHRGLEGDSDRVDPGAPARGGPCRPRIFHRHDSSAAAGRGGAGEEAAAWSE